MDQVFETKWDCIKAVQKRVRENNLLFVDYRIIKDPEGYRVHIIVEEEKEN